jgi:hypothetical protein
MNKRIKYTNEPLGEVRVVRDFLPPPDQLVFREEPIKVTLALSRRSVEFFKEEAARHHTQYQKMIRRLLDQYAEHYSQRAAVRASRPGRRRPAA